MKIGRKRLGPVRASVFVPVAVALAAFASAIGCRRTPAGGELLRGSGEVFTVGDPGKGGDLVEKLQCGRCHAGDELHTKREKACVTCHEQIVAATFGASPASLAKWQPTVKDLRFAPTLDGVGRFRSSWLVRYLQHPHDLRPALTMTMPRLAISEADARHITAYLKSKPPVPPALNRAIGAPELPRGDAAHGQAVLASKGCMTCHRLTGGPAIAASPIPVTVTADRLERSMALAPDLREARERFEPAMLGAWIAKPSALKPNSDMPDIPLTEDDARDVATFLFTVPLAPSPKPAFARLPALSRPVKFDEVNAKVFHRTCRHCHSEPDLAMGDGDPGNSGGFGFPARGVDLSSYQGVMAGFFEAPGTTKRKSLFSPTADGTPRLLAALLARHTEEGGAKTGEVRGMPLALPPLPAEDIQLVESWITQGTRR